MTDEPFVADPDVAMPPAVQQRNHDLCIAASAEYRCRDAATSEGDADWHQALGDALLGRSIALCAEWSE